MNTVHELKSSAWTKLLQFHEKKIQLNSLVTFFVCHARVNTPCPLSAVYTLCSVLQPDNDSAYSHDHHLTWQILVRVQQQGGREEKSQWERLCCRLISLMDSAYSNHNYWESINKFPLLTGMKSHRASTLFHECMYNSVWDWKSQPLIMMKELYNFFRLTHFRCLLSTTVQNEKNQITWITLSHSRVKEYILCSVILKVGLMTLCQGVLTSFHIHWFILKIN